MRSQPARRVSARPPADRSRIALVRKSIGTGKIVLKFLGDGLNVVIAIDHHVRLDVKDFTSRRYLTREITYERNYWKVKKIAACEIR